MPTAVIRAGSIVQVCGFPVRLQEDVCVETNDRTVTLIQKAREHDTVATLVAAPTTKTSPILPEDVPA